MRTHRGKGRYVYRGQPLTQLAPPTMLVTVTATQEPLEVVSGFKWDGLAKVTMAGFGIGKDDAAVDAEISPVPSAHVFHRAIAILVER